MFGQPLMFYFASLVAAGYLAVSVQMTFIYMSFGKSKVTYFHRRMFVFLMVVAYMFSVYFGHTVFGLGQYPITFIEVVGWSLNVLGITAFALLSSLIARQEMALEIIEGTVGQWNQ